MLFYSLKKKAKGLFLSARVKPLLLGMGPVLVGAGLAFHHINPFNYGLNIQIIICVLCIQLATHFFNDAFDFLKGADSPLKQGPKRALQLSLLSPFELKIAGAICLLSASVIGLPLVIQGGLFIFIIGILSLLLAYLYTGGPFSLSYTGLADFFVLLFFGLVPVTGTFYLNIAYLSWDCVIAGLQCGFVSLSLLVLNNLRDEVTDKLASKKTLVVRWGANFGRKQWLFCHILALVLNFYWFFKWSHLLFFSKFLYYAFFLFFLVLYLFFIYKYLQKALEDKTFYKKVFNHVILYYLGFVLYLLSLFLYMFKT